MRPEIEEALYVYFSRQRGITKPEGREKRHKRWFPDKKERQLCCKLMRRPTRKKPHILFQHCCSLEHVANLCEVDPNLLRSCAMEEDAEQTVLEKFE